MFIYSVKSSTIKVFSVIAISLIMLGVILSLGQSQTVYASVDGIEINYGGIDNNEDRINFINQFTETCSANEYSQVMLAFCNRRAA